MRDVNETMEMRIGARNRRAEYAFLNSHFSIEAQSWKPHPHGDRRLELRELGFC
jgi:hypothetical protein